MRIIYSTIELLPEPFSPTIAQRFNSILEPSMFSIRYNSCGTTLLKHIELFLISIPL